MPFNLLKDAKRYTFVQPLTPPSHQPAFVSIHVHPTNHRKKRKKNTFENPTSNCPDTPTSPRRARLGRKRAPPTAARGSQAPRRSLAKRAPRRRSPTCRCSLRPTRRLRSEEIGLGHRGTSGRRMPDQGSARLGNKPPNLGQESRMKMNAVQ